MKVEFNSRQFLTVLRAVMRFAAPRKSARPSISAVMFETGENVIEMAATNGHVMVQAHFPAPGMTSQPGLDASVQLATCERLVSVLRGVGVKAPVVLDLGILTAECDGVTVQLRRESQPFPAYKKVLSEARSASREIFKLDAKYVKLIGDTFHGAVSHDASGAMSPVHFTGTICPAIKERKKKSYFLPRYTEVCGPVKAIAVVMPTRAE